MNSLFKPNSYSYWGTEYFITLWITVSLYISLVIQMCRMFNYLMVIFGIILASLVPKDVTLASVISYGVILASFDAKAGITRVALASLVSNFWHFGIFGFFWHLASWDLKVGIIRDQMCLNFSSSTFSWWLLLGVMMPKCPKYPNAKTSKKIPKPENDCWSFINVDANGRGLSFKTYLETIESHMVSHSHSLHYNSFPVISRN